MDTAHRRAVRRGPVLWLVLHSTEGYEGPGRAIACARWLAKPKKRGRRSSAHYILDGRDIVHLVHDDAEAWHAGTTANKHGIGIELCGSARQTREQWLDAQSAPMLIHAAMLIRALADRHAIPLNVACAQDLKQFRRGVTTHADVTMAFGETTHWDPGPSFPMMDLIIAARRAPPQLIS